MGKKMTTTHCVNKKQFIEIAKTTSEMNQLQFYDIEFYFPLVRIFVDKKPSLNVGDCAKFLKSMKFLLKGEGIEDVELEVSSPGIERKLSEEWHFQSAVGSFIKVYTKEPFCFYDEKKQEKRESSFFTGRLDECQSQKIRVNDGTLDLIIPLKIVRKANVYLKEKKECLR